MTTVTEVQQHNAQSRERVIEATMALGVTVDPALVQAAMMELAAIWREEAAAFVEAKRRGWKSTADGRTQAAALLAGFAVGLTRQVVSTGTLTITPGEVAAARNQGTYDITGVSGTVAEEAGSLTVGEADEAATQAEAETAAAFDAMREACAHPDSARSTLKSGVIMCTLCKQAVGQVEHLPALVPGSKPGPVITGDPTMDYLTGATDRYEPFGYVPHRLEVPAEMIPAETPPGSLTFPGQPGYREAEHGRPQAPCFECLSIDEDPTPWCDCTPQDGQPCKGPCRLLAHAYTFHPQGCTHRAITTNPDPTKCMYCLADLTHERVDLGVRAAVAMEEGVELVPTFPDGVTPIYPPAAAVENPFTSPVAPTRNRPAVKRLTYADLGPLTAATYPYPRAHLSHSYVESLSKCGLSALLSDASRAGHVAPRRPSWSLIGGNAFHVAIEGIERASIAIGGAAPTADHLGDWEVYWNTALNSQIDEVRESLAGSPYADPSTWHIANKGLEGYDWWRVQGLDMVQRYLAHHDTAWRSTHTLLQVPIDRVLTPVLELPFTVSAGSTAITMEGRIDAAWLATGPEYPTATLEVVDHKAGKSLPVDHFQLVEYADVLRKHLPPNFALSVVGRYWRARLGTYTPPVPLPSAPGQAEIDYRYSAAERAMKHAVFAPHVDNMCSSCGAVDLCPAQSMRDGASA